MTFKIKQKESTIENAFVRKMKAHHILTRKMNGGGFRSWPDRMIVLYKMTPYIEFKRPGETSTELQEDCHEVLRGLGHPVEVFTDAVSAEKWILALHKKAERQRKRDIENNSP